MAVTLPNIRKLFIPDPGYVMFDCDLAGADAQVVAWESDDEDLKEAFRAGLDVHDKNARDLAGDAYDKLPGTTESGPKAKKRKQFKQAVHATNYGGSPTALHKHPGIGWPMRECEAFQHRWFSLHPKIYDWHKRITKQLNTNKTVANAFGYRRIFFDRPDQVFPEALAWIPQSSVALVSFHGAIQLEEQCPWVEMLLQVHDSLVFQVPKEKANEIEAIKAGLRIALPYADPLYIPWGIARSEKSWGDVEKVAA